MLNTINKILAPKALSKNDPDAAKAKEEEEQQSGWRDLKKKDNVSRLPLDWPASGRYHRFPIQDLVQSHNSCPFSRYTYKLELEKTKGSGGKLLEKNETKTHST